MVSCGSGGSAAGERCSKTKRAGTVGAVPARKFYGFNGVTTQSRRRRLVIATS